MTVTLNAPSRATLPDPPAPFLPSPETDSPMMLRRTPAPATPPRGTPAATPDPPRAPQARQLTLTPQPSAVTAGRHAVTETLHGWKLDAIADTAALLTSELLTNAVKATGLAAPVPSRGQLTLTLRRTPAGILVEVRDPCPDPAIQRVPAPTDESGRGLLLVQTLSSAWGQHTADGGKTVWCEITLP